jgi:hypothetical protein
LRFVGNEHPKLNLTFIDAKTKHLQKKNPIFYFIFSGLFFVGCHSVKICHRKKKQNNDSYAPPPRRDLGYDKLFTRETWTKLKFFPQDFFSFDCSQPLRIYISI